MRAEFYLVAAWGIVMSTLANAVEASTNVLATPVRIVESRDEQMDPVEKGTFEGPHLHIDMKFEGEAMRNAVAWANLRIDEAIDDQARRIPWSKSDTVRNARLQEIDAKKSPADRRFIVVAIEMGGAFPHATKIVRLRGQLQVRTDDGSTKTVVVPKLKSNVGTWRNHRVITVAGLQLDIEEELGSRGRELYVSVHGELATLKAIDVTDSDGKTLGQASLRERDRPPETRGSIDLPRPVDDRMSLRIEVAAGQKVQIVPFDLKDIPLP